MKFKERLLIFLKSFNPDAHGDLAAKLSLWDAVKQFFFVFLLLFTVMLLLFIPAAFLDVSKLQSAISSFESFQLDGNVTASAPFVLVDSPKVGVDLSANASLRDEKVLFTSAGVEWKQWYFFGHARQPWDSLRDVTGMSSGAIAAAFLFLAPSMAFWLGVVLLLKYLFIVFVFGLLAWLVPRFWRTILPFGIALKLSLFASAVMLLVEMLVLPFTSIVWIPFLLYVLLLAVSVAIVGQRDFAGEEKRGKEKGGKGERKRPRPDLEIWKE